MAVRRRVRFKADDIWEAPDDEYRYEVIDGELFMTPSPSSRHQHIVMKLSANIAPWIYRHGLGRAFQAPLAVVLDPETAVQPDLLYVAREREGIISERGVEGAPDLVVEVLSPKTAARDRGIKMRRYAAAGIAHYWIVDPEAPTVESYRLGEHGYDLTGVYGPSRIFEPALFPGLAIPVDDLWS